MAAVPKLTKNMQVEELLLCSEMDCEQKQKANQMCGVNSKMLLDADNMKFKNRFIARLYTDRQLALQYIIHNNSYAFPLLLTGSFPINIKALFTVNRMQAVDRSVRSHQQKQQLHQ